MKESYKQALKMAQQSMKQIAEQMMVMYNIVQAKEKENDDHNKEKGRRRQMKKYQFIQKVQQSQCIQKGKQNCVKSASRWNAILKNIVLISKIMRNIGRSIGNPGSNEMKRRKI